MKRCLKTPIFLAVVTPFLLTPLTSQAYGYVCHMYTPDGFVYWISDRDESNDPSPSLDIQCMPIAPMLDEFTEGA